MQVCADLYSAATADSLPSEEMVNLLTEVLFELPDLGDKLLRAVGLIHLRLDIHVACLHRYLDELSDADATSNISSHEPSDAGQHVAAAQFCRLLSLFDVPQKAAAEKKAELHRLLLRIVNLLFSGVSKLDRTMVLSCLLAQKSQLMCRWFIKLLDHASLRHLISRSVPPHIGSVYSHSIAPSYSLPIISFHKEKTLSIEIASECKNESESEVIIGDTARLQSMMDKTEILSSLSSNINDDIVHVVALSSSASHRSAWYHLYLTCFERRIHFLDLFLVCNILLSFYTLLIFSLSCGRCFL